jgi:hypothetical protein
MSEIRADLSQYYPLKALLEQILGRKSFSRVKDHAPLPVWKSEISRLIRALGIAIQATVDVADDEWHVEARDILAHGLDMAKSARGADELFAGLSATLAKLSFLQIGFVPQGHRFVDQIPLVRRNWQLRVVRSVQYVQSPAQIAAQKKGRRRVRDGAT